MPTTFHFALVIPRIYCVKKIRFWTAVVVVVIAIIIRAYYDFNNEIL